MLLLQPPQPHDAGSKRTLGVYSNDVAVLGDTEDGRYLPNDDV